ncbi:MAG: hypothetical protein SRB2_04799 [Desulfobacteraceae bacterium Eth-SRB2]|nr:MAG: hypothetical protein SRB2_04799 [Desulfobacteraceae bacterium Eth-SRB2]
MFPETLGTAVLASDAAGDSRPATRGFDFDSDKKVFYAPTANPAYLLIPAGESSICVQKEFHEFKQTGNRGLIAPASEVIRVPAANSRPENKN